MPELPEVEHVRRSLREPVIGAHVQRVIIRRADVAWSEHAARPASTVELLEGARVSVIHRHGKQLAIVAEDGRAMCVQLGMTGGMLVRPNAAAVAALDHAHVVWQLGAHARQRPGRFLVFRDPRRFGGITCYPSFDALRRERWGRLGPDALSIDAAALAAALAGSSRAVKCVLLDQNAIAGVGNIYADEALFRARVSPRLRASLLRPPDIELLSAAIRAVLVEAVNAGGSTIRDYRDASGQSGTFQSRHLVYGRAGQACSACGSTLRKLVVAQRTTVMCPRCQATPKRRKPRSDGNLSTSHPT